MGGGGRHFVRYMDMMFVVEGGGVVELAASC